jgi:hypothetical protein
MQSTTLPPDVRDFFDRYRDAFDRLDADAAARLYSTPSGILSGGTYLHWPDFESVRANVAAVCKQYRTHGYLSAHYQPAWVERQGPNAVIANIAWHIERRDGKEPWRFHTTYNLMRTSAGWRILLCTQYEEQPLES